LSKNEQLHPLFRPDMKCPDYMMALALCIWSREWGAAV